MHGEEILKVNSLYKDYGEFKLGPIDYSFKAGVVYGLVGLNGAGKSTFLKAIANEITYSGKIEKKARVFFMPEVPRFLDFLYPEEWLKFFCSWNSIPFDGSFKEILEEFEIPKKMVVNLSAGNRQKLFFISVLMGEGIFLLDEPFTWMDVRMRRKAKSLLEWKVKGKKKEEEREDEKEEGIPKKEIPKKGKEEKERKEEHGENPRNPNLRNLAIISSHDYYLLSGLCDVFLYVENGKMREMKKSELKSFFSI
jgi:ATPase subunit of ABC transporter with duplicated ATPase domains